MEPIDLNRTISYSFDKFVPLSLSNFKFLRRQNVLEYVANKFFNGITEDFFFPAQSTSLYGQYFSKDNLSVEDLDSVDKPIEFRPLSKLFKAPTITNNNFSPYDIKQGALGNCYFLSALGAVASNPENIANLFVYVDIEQLKDIAKSGDWSSFNDPDVLDKLIKPFESIEGIPTAHLINDYYNTYFSTLKAFFIRLKVHGEWRIIVVDEYLPINTDTGNLIFGRSLGQDLWVSIVEKAWSKVIGAYYRTSMGSPAEGNSSLANGPSISYNHKDIYLNLLWSELKNLQNTDKSCSSIIQRSGDNKSKAKSMGLILNHCYSVLRTAEADAKKFILLRNPHGSSGWTGNYADGSNKWTVKLRTAIKAEDKDEASFWMDFEEYFAFFDWTFINHNERNFVSRNYKIKKSDFEAGSQYFCFVLNVLQVANENAKLYVNYVPKYRRIYGKKERSDVTHAVIGRLDGGKLKGENVEYVAGNHGNMQVNNMIGKAKEGSYVYVVKVNNAENSTGFVIQCYSHENTIVQVELVKVDEEETISMNKAILLDFIRNEEIMERQKITDSSIKKFGMSDVDSGYCILYYDNRFCKQQLMVNYSCPATNMDIEKKLKGANGQLIVKAGEEGLLYWCKFNMNCKINLKTREIVEFSTESLKSMIWKEGKKKEIAAGTGVYMYTLAHNKGYMLMLVNQGKWNKNVEINFSFENLKLNSGKTSFVTKLPKGSNEHIEVWAKDVQKAVKMTYKVVMNNY